jgi:hypothetical protein
MTPHTCKAGAITDVESLVSGFPTLDELEAHFGIKAPAEGADASPGPRVQADAERARGSIFPVSSRWYTASPPPYSFNMSAAPNVEAGAKPLATLLAEMNVAQNEARDLDGEISRQNDLAVNKFLLDRVIAHARTDYGTDITGFFVNGIGFGSVQQTLRQEYGLTYSLPLLQRFSRSSKWTRVLSGWTVSSDVGVMPRLGEAAQLQQLLNNLQLTWSVSLSYRISGAMLRRIQDGQYDQEAALGKANNRATASRQELLKVMALRIDALAANRPTSETRTTSLRELYPQFELYQARFQQASSCDERMEDFFTLKGLALSLLTLAGYDRQENPGSDLLQTWKKAKFAGCGRT